MRSDKNCINFTKGYWQGEAWFRRLYRRSPSPGIADTQLVTASYQYVLVEYYQMHQNLIGRALKRFMDFLVSSLLLVLLLPVLLGVALLVRFRLGTPVLFRQKRVGKYESQFDLIKFRSMIDERGVNGELIPENERLTPFGRALRATSIDELPTLWLVLKGSMSLVGPRPLLVEYVPLYNDRQRRRHQVKPGITGWAQVKGRNAISWEQKFDHDVWYVENQSLLLDFRILLLTVMKVLKREDIDSPTHGIMEKFSGSSSKQGTR